MSMTRDDFASWLDHYIAAWRSGDADEIGDLFSEDVTYSQTGGQSVIEGREAVVRDWLEAAYEPEERKSLLFKICTIWEEALGNLEEARNFLQQAWDMTRDGEIGAHLGEVMWMQGDRDDARRIWAESKESSPDNPVLKKVLDRFMP